MLDFGFQVIKKSGLYEYCEVRASKFDLGQGHSDHSQRSHGEMQGEGYYDKKINWYLILRFEKMKIRKAQRYKTVIIILLEYQLEISKTVFQWKRIFCVKTTWV